VVDYCNGDFVIGAEESTGSESVRAAVGSKQVIVKICTVIEDTIIFSAIRLNDDERALYATVHHWSPLGLPVDNESLARRVLSRRKRESRSPPPHRCARGAVIGLPCWSMKITVDILAATMT
jgi:hypothetical protein